MGQLAFFGAAALGLCSWSRCPFFVSPILERGNATVDNTQKSDLFGWGASLGLGPGGVPHFLSVRFWKTETPTLRQQGDEYFQRQDRKIEWIYWKNERKKKVTSPCGSQLVPHASTKPAQDDLASQFGMRYGRLRLV